MVPTFANKKVCLDGYFRGYFLITCHYLHGLHSTIVLLLSLSQAACHKKTNPLPHYV